MDIIGFFYKEYLLFRIAIYVKKTQPNNKTITLKTNKIKNNKTIISKENIL